MNRRFPPFKSSLLRVVLLSIALLSWTGMARAQPGSGEHERPKLINPVVNKRNKAVRANTDSQRVPAADQIEDLLSLGNTALEANKYDEALKAYQRVVVLNPREYRGYLGIGNTYTSRNSSSEESVKAYQQVVRLKPDIIDGYYGLGNAYRLNRQYGLAIKQYNEVIRLKPNDALAHYYLGHAYIDTKDVSNAIEQYKKAISLNKDLLKEFRESIIGTARGPEYIEIIRGIILFFNPSDAEAYNKLGKMYAEQKRYDEAIESYKVAIQLKPSFWYYRALAALYAEQKRTAELTKTFEQFVKTTPNENYPHFILGVAYRSQQRSAEAIEQFKQSLQISQNTDALVFYFLGTTYYEQRNYNETIIALKQAIRLMEKDSNAYEYGLYQSIGFMVSKDLSERPLDRARYNLGDAYIQVKNKDAALEQARILSQTWPYLSQQLLNKANKMP